MVASISDLWAAEDYRRLAAELEILHSQQEVVVAEADDCIAGVEPAVDIAGKGIVVEPDTAVDTVAEEDIAGIAAVAVAVAATSLPVIYCVAH